MTRSWWVAALALCACSFDPPSSTAVSKDATVCGADCDASVLDVGFPDTGEPDGGCTGASCNRPPLAVDDTVSVEAGAEVTADVLANDLDPDGDRLEVVSHGGGVLGFVVRTSGGLRYRARIGVSGVDVIPYSITDPAGSTASARLVVTVLGENLPPVATDVRDRTFVDAPIDLLLSATDPNGDLLRFEVVTPPAQGQIGPSPRSPAHLRFVPARGFDGTVRFTYRARDAALTSNTATVTLDVTEAPEGWWESRWTRRRRIDVAALRTEGQPQNVPLLIRLDPSRIDYGRAAPDGSDLRFVAGEGSLLPHEIERWVPGGTSLVWVRSPALDDEDPTRIRLYYGNVAATAPADDGAVWATFQGVWHLGSDLRDSSANRQSATSTTALTVTGTIGDAQQLGGAAWIDLPRSLLRTEEGAIGLWLRTAAVPPAGEPAMILYGTDDASLTGDGFGAANEVHFAVEPDGRLSFFIQGPLNFRLETPAPIADGQWHWVSVSYRRNQESVLWVDGQRADGANHVAQSFVASVLLRLGAPARPVRFFDGDADELRISTAPRSAAFLEAEYRAMADPGFITHGPEEP